MNDDFCERCGRGGWAAKIKERKLCHDCYCKVASQGAALDWLREMEQSGEVKESAHNSGRHSANVRKAIWEKKLAGKGKWR